MICPPDDAVASIPAANVEENPLFLIIGIFAMLYVRDRRLWVWIQPSPDGRTEAEMALSTNRRTLDGDAEFQQLSNRLLQVKP